MPNVADDDMETLIFSDESEGTYDPGYYDDAEQPYPAWMEEDRY